MPTRSHLLPSIVGVAIATALMCLFIPWMLVVPVSWGFVWGASFMWLDWRAAAEAYAYAEEEREHLAEMKRLQDKTWENLVAMRRALIGLLDDRDPAANETHEG